MSQLAEVGLTDYERMSVSKSAEVELYEYERTNLREEESAEAERLELPSASVQRKRQA